jgi:hypothetical protein
VAKQLLFLKAVIIFHTFNGKNVVFAIFEGEKIGSD